MQISAFITRNLDVHPGETGRFGTLGPRVGVPLFARNTRLTRHPQSSSSAFEQSRNAFELENHRSTLDDGGLWIIHLPNELPSAPIAEELLHNAEPECYGLHILTQAPRYRTTICVV